MSRDSESLVKQPQDPIEVSLAAENVEREAWLDLFEAAPDHVRAAFELASTRIGTMGLLASRGLPITEFNRVMNVNSTGALTQTVLTEVCQWMDKHAHADWAFQLAPSAGETSNVTAIEQLGFRPTGTGWAKFVTHLSQAPAIDLPAAVTIRVADSSLSQTFGTAVQAGFGLPPEGADWFASLVGRPGWHCFIASVGDEPAAAAAMFIRGATAWTGVCLTLSAYRKRGLQAQLIAARLKTALEHGASLVTSETGQPPSEQEPGHSSYRNQKRSGFEHLYIRQNFKRT